MRTMARLTQRVGVVSLVALLAMAIASQVVRGQAQHIRWDIVSIDFSVPSPRPLSAGGIASANANDGSQITLTGSGTFVAPGGSSAGSDSAVTGGGSWVTHSAAGALTGSGTYEVTGLVRWERAPGNDPNPPSTDLIDGNTAKHSAGLAVLRIIYSDGTRGILVVSCRLVGTPGSVFEGITASKGFVDYWNHVAPVPGVDANRTVFHIE